MDFAILLMCVYIYIQMYIYLFPIHNICMGALIGTEIIILTMITVMLLQKDSSRR